MKLTFGLFALAAAQEIYDPENCANGNNRCDGTCSQVVFQRESCNDNRIDRACCTVQEACVLVNDEPNVSCRSFPAVLDGGIAFNCFDDCGVATTTIVGTQTTKTVAQGDTQGTTGGATTGGATTGGTGTTEATTPIATTTAGTILTTVSTLLISLLALH